MNGWTILLVILLILVLLSLVRVGAEVSYGAEGMGVRVRLGQFKLTILPAKKKENAKPKKEKKPKSDKKAASSKASSTHDKKPGGEGPEEAPPKEGSNSQEEGKNESPKEKKPKGGLPIPLVDLISIAVDAVGQTLSRLQIDVLHIEYTIGGRENPANAAIQYGMLYAGGGAIVPMLENTFYSVKKREIQAAIDFESDTSLVYLCLALSIRIGQIFAIGGHLVWAFLKSFIKEQRTKKQEGKNNGTESSDQ